MGRIIHDGYRKELARQGDALLERVALVRKLYADLQRVADAERAARHVPAP